RKRAYCLKIQPATGSFARNLIYSTKPLGGSNYGILEKLDTFSDRRVDNSNFFAIDNFATVKDEVLYEQLLEEFKDWLEQAKVAGIA
ncbi:VWA domain-containing protein, partial [Klebsiella pasteurii]|uniref:VWA domain-containing protein n=1 Tax=Klebsiella pasteurii TaxID=2587529 RepID=UPI00287F0D74